MAKIVLLLFSVLLVACSEKKIEVKEAWIRATPPSSKVMVAYMNLYNYSGADVVLTGAESQDFNRVEIHETRIKNEKMAMIRHNHVKIKDAEVLQFRPKSWHFMLLGPKKTKKPGDKVTLKLWFKNYQEHFIEVPMQVRQSPP